MPILDRGTTVFPETLLETQPLLESGPLESTARRWWVLYTRSRQEKAIARALLGREIPFYLPLVRRTLRHRGKNRRSFVPLFSGYLFMYGSEEERGYALTTNRISQTLIVPEPERFFYDLQRIHRLIGTNAPLTPESRLVPGNRVRVKGGPFAGFEGTILRRRGETRLLVAVDFLQQGVSVQIDDFMLDAI